MPSPWRLVEELRITEPPAPAAEEPSTPAGDNVRRFLLDVLETLILSIILYLIINGLSARVRVDGTSMLPTLEDGQYVLVNRISYMLADPALGDIVVFRFPQDPSEDYIKRIIGVPGDTVVIVNGQVSVNGALLQEPYIAAAPSYNGSWQVPPDSLFVLGDNRNYSSDSHAWNFVPMENLIGKAIFVYWPFKDFNWLPAADQAIAAPQQ